MLEIPYSEVAEQSLILSCFMSSDALYTATERIESKDFYNQHYQSIYRLIEKLQSSGTGIDRTTISNEITNNGIKETFDGLFNGTIDCDPANVVDYCDILEEKTKLRLTLQATYEVQSLIKNGQASADHILDVTQESLFKASQRKDANSLLSAASIIENLSHDINARVGKSTEELLGIPSGIKCFDDLWLGAEPGQLIVLAARPSMGKTQLAVQLAINAAKQGGTVLFYSLEMSANELMERVVSQMSTIYLDKIRKGQLSPRDIQQLSSVYSDIQNLPLLIDDNPMQTSQSIMSKTRRVAMQHDDLSMLVLDYMQLMKGIKGASNRQEEMTDISRSLKILAKMLNIPVIALSQLSRSCEARDDKRPLLSDLRESGAIEQDADKVIFVYSDSKYIKDPTPEQESKTELILRKHRNGPTGTAHIRNHKRIQTMYDASKVNVDFKPIDSAKEEETTLF